MIKKLSVILMSLMMGAALFAVPVEKANAAEAVTVFIELTASSSTVFSGNYTRGRVDILDANGELATTFAGANIADAVLILSSKNFGSDVEFTDEPITDTNLTDWMPRAEDVSFNLDSSGVQEFAIRYHNNGDGHWVDGIGDDVIEATVKKGSSSITGTANIVVKPPKANCYVARTGQPADPIDEDLQVLPDPQNNNEGIVRAGQSIDVYVWAAYYNTTTGNYHYTSRLPDGADMLALGAGAAPSVGPAMYLNPDAGLSFAVVILTDGMAEVEMTITNLKIPTMLEIVHGTGCDAADMADFLDGIPVEFNPVPLLTRTIGTMDGDVTMDDALYGTIAAVPPAATTSMLGGIIQWEFSPLAPIPWYHSNDTATYIPGKVKDITIVGLPVNTITQAGDHEVSGIGEQGVAPGTFDPHPCDAYFLSDMRKPSNFRVAGNTTTYIYGAVLASDGDGNPAPIIEGDQAVIELFKNGDIAVDGGVTGDGVEIESWDPEWVASVTGGAFTLAENYQAFMPFRVQVTVSDGSPSLEDVFINAITGDSVSGSLYEDVDSVAEGVTFTGQDFVASCDMSDYAANASGESAGNEFDVIIEGSDDEQSFTMRGVQAEAGDTILLNEEDATDGLEEVTIPNDELNTAKVSVAVFTISSNIPPGENQFFIFEGEDSGTIFNQPQTIFPPMVAADAGDFPPSRIVAQVARFNTRMDDEEDHNVLVIDSTQNIVPKDPFGNSFRAPETLTDAELQAEVFLIADNGSVTDTPFPGASAKVEDTTIEVEFDLAQVTPDQHMAMLVLSTEDGSASASILVDVTALKSTGLMNPLVAMPDVAKTAIWGFIADTTGNPGAPVLIYDAGPDLPGQIEVDFEAEDGTTGFAETEIISTVAPLLTETAQRQSGADQMSITAESDYGDTTLVLTYVPDFEKPQVDSAVGGNCAIIITLSDNQEVDTAGTAVTVLNSDGEDVTATLTRTDSDNGTTGTITLTGAVIDVYSVIITPADGFGNMGDEVTKTVSVTECDLQPACLDIDPAFAMPGDTNLEVIITGQDTNFDDTTTVAFGCADVTVNSMTVNSATEIVLDISVPADAAEGDCDVTVTTGPQEVICEFAISVEVIPECTDEDGDGYGEGPDCTGPDCDDTDPAVNPGATEVCDDGIDNDCDGDIDDADSDCVPVCELVSIDPESITTILGISLRPFPVNVTVTGNEAASFTDDSAVSVGPLAVTRVRGSGNTVSFRVWTLGAADGEYDVSVDGCSGVTFTIN